MLILYIILNLPFILQRNAIKAMTIFKPIGAQASTILFKNAPAVIGNRQ